MLHSMAGDEAVWEEAGRRPIRELGRGKRRRVRRSFATGSQLGRAAMETRGLGEREARVGEPLGWTQGGRGKQAASRHLGARRGGRWSREGAPPEEARRAGSEEEDELKRWEISWAAGKIHGRRAAAGFVSRMAERMRTRETAAATAEQRKLRLGGARHGRAGAGDAQGAVSRDVGQRRWARKISNSFRPDKEKGQRWG